MLYDEDDIKEIAMFYGLDNQIFDAIKAMSGLTNILCRTALSNEGKSLWKNNIIRGVAEVHLALKELEYVIGFDQEDVERLIDEEVESTLLSIKEMKDEKQGT